MIELTRVPSRQYQQAQHRRDDLGWAVHLESFRKYDYTTPDGRWRVQQNRGCGGGWSIIDTKHEYICGSCATLAELNGSSDFDGHATTVRTLAAAKAFLAEWAL